MTKRPKKNGEQIQQVAILGCGNIGQALATGLLGSGTKPESIWMTRRQKSLLKSFQKNGCHVSSDNSEAVVNCSIIIIAVQPHQLIDLLNSIRTVLDSKKHTLISLVTSKTTDEIREQLDLTLSIVRAMPNTAVAIGESMTCIAANGRRGKGIQTAVDLFDKVGITSVIKEEHMTAATALCACGVAFFLRSIRAASQGGIQIGFHADEALQMAAQTARGAASLLLRSDNKHPESEIDRVTTPRGCTIAGLNRMEHAGFSSALIKGIITASQIAGSLSSDDE